MKFWNSPRQALESHDKIYCKLYTIDGYIITFFVSFVAFNELQLKLLLFLLRLSFQSTLTRREREQTFPNWFFSYSKPDQITSTRIQPTPKNKSWTVSEQVIHILTRAKKDSRQWNLQFSSPLFDSRKELIMNGKKSNNSRGCSSGALLPRISHPKLFQFPRDAHLMLPMKPHQMEINYHILKQIKQLA